MPITSSDQNAGSFPSSLILPSFAWPTVVSSERINMLPMAVDSKSNVPLIDSPPLAAPILAPEPVVTIFCGTLMGRLHLHYFQCPGIHQPCIEFDGEMITPKEFCYRANKDKQKDWKGSIRAGKRTLRYLMANKTVDFFNHREVCSGKCQSRNHLTRHVPKDLKPVKRELPVPMFPIRPMFPSGYMPYGIPHLHLPHGFSNLQKPMAMMAPPMQEGEVSPTKLAASCVGRGYPATPPQNGVMPAKLLLNFIDTDPLMFWNEIRRVNLLPEILDMASKLVRNICATAGDTNANLGGISPSLSRLTHALNLQPWIISLIQAHQSSYFAALKKDDTETEKKAPVGIRKPEETQPNEVTSDLEFLCDKAETIQQPKDTTASIDQPSSSPLRKRHQPVPDEVPCKKTIVESE